MKPHLARITIYPFKSMEGIELSSVNLLKNGALENDRRFAFVNAEGAYITGNRTLKMHFLRSQYDITTRTLKLRESETKEWHTFQIDDDRNRLEEWVSHYFEMPATLKEHDAGGFPDDIEYPGATVMSTATLEKVIEWYPEISLEEARKRFRANLEIGGVPAFWEDHLYRQKGIGIPFQIGDVRMLGMNPCARCAIPSRNPETGEEIQLFQKEFVNKRQAELPAWAEPTRFDHYYRLAVNTSIDPENQGHLLHVDDTVLLLDE